MRSPRFFLFAFASVVLLLGACAPAPPPQSQPAGVEEPATAASPASPATTAAAGDRYLYAAAPARGTYPNTWEILTDAGYESAYDETFRNPAWVAYHLSGSAGTTQPRPSGYATDLRTTVQVSAKDYPPGYDHGHMAPNEAIAEFFGAQAQTETFLMTNMLPQKHGLNAGPWKSEEHLEYATWEPEFKNVWVIDGPVYTTADDQPVAPDNRYGAKAVAIPVACFKIVLTQASNGQLQTLAFIMPQEPGPGHKPKEFLTSIREIERRTGLNFFPDLSPSKQDAIEDVVAADVWH